MELKDRFMALWSQYFGEEELPITFYYTSENGGAEWAKIPKGHSCLIAELARVRKGKPVVYNEAALTCGGAKRYLGYTATMRPGFNYFLSCGNEKIEGERYLRTPEQVDEFMKNYTKMGVADQNIVFKRWDKLEESDNPEVVIFFAKPDVLSGLFTLANFDQDEPNGTITPFGAGCGSIVYYPYMESKTKRQRAVIGMFDPSARPGVPANVLTFAVPMKRFEKMVGYMEESFLITKTWTVIKRRIEKEPVS